MGHIEVFNVQLSGFLGTLPLICRRDFGGSYFLESGNLKVRLERPWRLASNYLRLKCRIESAVQRDEELKPGAVWSHAGGIEFGVENDQVYVQVGALRVGLDPESTGRFGFALDRFYRDWNDVCGAGQPRMLPEHMRDPELALPAWAIDELWELFGTQNMKEQQQIARDFERNVKIIEAAIAAPPEVLDRLEALERLAQDQARTIAAQDARIAALEDRPPGDEDGAPRPVGVWCKTKEAARRTGYSRSGLRKLRQQRRIIFDFSGPHCLYDVTSIVRKVPA